MPEVSRSELDNIIDEWIIGRNSERNRFIIKDRLFNGYTYEHLGEIYDMSTPQIRKIITDGLKIIRKHLG